MGHFCDKLEISCHGRGPNFVAYSNPVRMLQAVGAQ